MKRGLPIVVCLALGVIFGVQVAFLACSTSSKSPTEVAPPPTQTTPAQVAGTFIEAPPPVPPGDPVPKTCQDKFKWHDLAVDGQGATLNFEAEDYAKGYHVAAFTPPGTGIGRLIGSAAGAVGPLSFKYDGLECGKTVPVQVDFGCGPPPANASYNGGSFGGWLGYAVMVAGQTCPSPSPSPCEPTYTETKTYEYGEWGACTQAVTPQSEIHPSCSRSRTVTTIVWLTNSCTGEKKEKGRSTATESEPCICSTPSPPPPTPDPCATPDAHRVRIFGLPNPCPTPTPPSCQPHYPDPAYCGDSGTGHECAAYGGVELGRNEGPFDASCASWTPPSGTAFVLVKAGSCRSVDPDSDVYKVYTPPLTGPFCSGSGKTVSHILACGCPEDDE